MDRSSFFFEDLHRGYRQQAGTYDFLSFMIFSEMFFKWFLKSPCRDTPKNVILKSSKNDIGILYFFIKKSTCFFFF
jgi:hypothetical protein